MNYYCCASYALIDSGFVIFFFQYLITYKLSFWIEKERLGKGNDSVPPNEKGCVNSWVSVYIPTPRFKFSELTTESTYDTFVVTQSLFKERKYRFSYIDFLHNNVAKVLGVFRNKRGNCSYSKLQFFLLISNQKIFFKKLMPSKIFLTLTNKQLLKYLFSISALLNEVNLSLISVSDFIKARLFINKLVNHLFFYRSVAFYASIFLAIDTLLKITKLKEFQSNLFRLLRSVLKAARLKSNFLIFRQDAPAYQLHFIIRVFFKHNLLRAS